MIRTLTGENKSSDLSPEIMNDALLDQTCKSLSAAKQIDVIHDPLKTTQNFENEHSG